MFIFGAALAAKQIITVAEVVAILNYAVDKARTTKAAMLRLKRVMPLTMAVHIGVMVDTFESRQEMLPIVAVTLTTVVVTLRSLLVRQEPTAPSPEQSTYTPAVTAMMAHKNIGPLETMVSYNFQRVLTLLPATVLQAY
jgi:hypothetical protein